MPSAVIVGDEGLAVDQRLNVDAVLHHISTEVCETEDDQ
jgi:hypothetical protein